MFIYYLVARERYLVKKKNKKLSKLTVAIFFIVALVLGYFYEKFVSDPSEKSSQEHQIFVNTHLRNLLIEDLPSGSYKISQIQKRYNILWRKIIHNYGDVNPLGFIVEDAEHPLSPFSTVTSRFQDGDPAVVVFLSPLMNLFETERDAGATEEDSERSFLIDYIHQLDHLALGHLPKKGETPTQKKVTRNEITAWAQTCEFAIRPILEIRGLRVAPRHSAFYKAWVASGRNLESPKWRAFIEKDCFVQPK